MSTPTAPRGLDRAGKALWRTIAGKYDLRPDELAVLEDACRVSDQIVTLEDGMVGQPLMARGAQQQDVVHPLIVELRMQRATRARLLGQLKLPDESGRTSEETISNQARAAANARWSRRGAGA